MEDSKQELAYWTRRTLEKLGLFQGLGADFKHTYWIFDWDTKEPDTTNIERYGKECRALIALSTTGTIGIQSAIPLTEMTRRYPEINKHGIDLPFSVDAAGAAGRGTGWYRAFWITDFDYDKYLKQCEVYSVRPSHKLISKSYSRQPIDPDQLRVVPSSYDSTNRVLVLAGVRVAISKQPRKKTEGIQPKLVRLLFDVKYFQNGVGLSKIYPVRDWGNARNERKKAGVLVTAINSKLPEELKGQELIKFDGTRFYIDPRYR